MLRRLNSLNLAFRLARCCIFALYGATVVLGAGGLHALAPACSDHCAVEESAPAVHSHQGCTHRHPHRHSPEPTSGDSAPRPSGKHEGCLICDFAAMPVVVATIVSPPAVVEAVSESMELPAEEPTLSVWAVLCIRGPPQVIL